MKFNNSNNHKAASLTGKRSYYLERWNNKEDIITEDALCVDVILSIHGMRGEAEASPTTDNVTRFRELKEVILDTGKKQKILTIEHVEFFKNMAILKSKGHDNINDIEIYKGKDLLTPREQAVKLASNENLIMDLIGLKMAAEDGDTFDMMTDVLQTGANDVYVVETPERKEVLLPTIPSCILDVNLETSTMTVRILNGLLDS